MEKLPANLVALIYSPSHSSYPEVIPAEDLPGLEIDSEKGIWSYRHPGSKPDNRPPKKIGEYNYFAKESSSGVIGVYDRTNNKHLTSIARDWQATQEAKNINWHNVD